jgi:hypothetical protein
MPSDSVMARQLVIIGQSQSKRIHDCLDAARALGFRMPRVVSYLDVIRFGLDGVGIPEGALVRLESPGESWELERALLKAGIESLNAASETPVARDELDSRQGTRGEIHAPRQWYFGFREVLVRMSREAHGIDGLTWMTPPEDVISMFDKQACRDVWTGAGLPMPNDVPGVRRYDELRSRIGRRHGRVFVKLRYGFSAMGAMAIEWRGDRVRAITTVESLHEGGRPRLFLSKKVRVLQREFEVAWLTDTLGVEGIIVEDWLPKSRWDARPFDMRVVVIGGHASHIVGRSSSTPFTNLNLDSRRIPAEILQAHLGEHWDEALSVCEQASSSFPQSTSVGIDLLVRPCRRRFALLEANAFGDYLPRLLADGRDTYSAALSRFTPRQEVVEC